MPRDRDTIRLELVPPQTMEAFQHDHPDALCAFISFQWKDINFMSSGEEDF